MVTVKEFHKKFGISRNTLYKHLRAKKIKARQHPLSRRWMIHDSEVERLQKEIEIE